MILCDKTYSFVTSIFLRDKNNHNGHFKTYFVTKTKFHPRSKDRQNWASDEHFYALFCPFFFDFLRFCVYVTKW